MKHAGAFSLVIVAAVALLAAGCGDGDKAPTSVPADSVAMVGDIPIKRVALDEALAADKVAYAARGSTYPDPETTDYAKERNKLLDDLVKAAEFREQAKKIGVEISPTQVDNAIASDKRQNYSGSDQAYSAALAKQGLTEREVRFRITQQLLAAAVFEKVTKDVDVTDSDLNAYYQEHLNGYKQPARRQVRLIDVKTKAEAEKIERQLRGGADFATLARRYSLDTASRDSGGTVEGGLTKGQSQPPLDRAVFSLPTKKISAPVATQYGWYVVQPLTDIVPETITPLSKVRPVIAGELLRTKRSSAMKAWVNNVYRDFRSKVLYAKGFDAPPQAQ